MKNINIAGHEFKPWAHTTSLHCAKCGMGYGTYLNHKQGCSNWNRVADEKLLIFGWIVTILGIPEKADPTKYNKLTDKLYELMEFRK